MNVIFLEPGFPANQREFVRALASVGAIVLGVGDRPYDWLDDELKGWLGGYQQIALGHRRGRARMGGARRSRARMWVDRLEAVVEAHVHAGRARARALRHPGHLGAHRLSLPRQGGDEGGAAHAPACRPPPRPGSPASARRATSSRRVGFPVILKPRDAAGASGTFRADNLGELADAARASGLADGAPVAIEEFVEGHEGFYDTLTVNGRVAYDFVSHYYPNVLEAMRTRWISPQIVATNRIDEPGYDEVKEMGAAGDRRRSASAPRRRTWSGSSARRA